MRHQHGCHALTLYFAPFLSRSPFSYYTIEISIQGCISWSF